MAPLFLFFSPRGEQKSTTKAPGKHDVKKCENTCNKGENKVAKWCFLANLIYAIDLKLGFRGKIDKDLFEFIFESEGPSIPYPSSP